MNRPSGDGVPRRCMANAGLCSGWRVTAATQLQCSAVSWCVCVLGLYSAGCVYHRRGGFLKIGGTRTCRQQGRCDLHATNCLPTAAAVSHPIPDSSTVFFFPTLFFGLVKVHSYQGTGPDLAVAVFQISNFRSTAFLGVATCLYFSLRLFDPNTCHRQGNTVP